MSPVLLAVPTVASVAVGVAVFRARRRRIGSLLVLHGLCFALLLSFTQPSEGGAGAVVDQLGAGSWVFLFLWLVLIAYVLPDERPASPFWRRWVAGGLVAVAVFLVGSAGDAAGYRATHHGTPPPVPWLPETVSGLLGVVGLLGTVLLLGGSAFAVRGRLRQAAGEERVQLLWLVWGATSLPVALALAWVGHFGLDDDPLVVNAALLLAGTALPITIGVAVLRHRLFDIRPVLSRTVTYGLLLGAVVSLYAGLLLAAEHVLGSSAWGGLMAVGIIAVAVHPAEAWLRARVERWVYGDRGDPAMALRRLAAATESAESLGLVAAITDTVAQALRVHDVWVEATPPADGDDQGVVRATLEHRGERYGALAVAVPAGREMSAADRDLLADLARYAAVTVRAARLAEDLQASRSGLVTAREEERKRLRRDLHDGIGPSLAAILLKLEVARSTRSEQARDELLGEIRDETRAAVTEVRRVVDDLRPPAIDEVGLVGALRQRADSLSGGRVVFDIDTAGPLPALPAAVEVAAFRIVSEALTNVTRHSGATRCRLEVTADHDLCLTVSDNGRGAGPDSRPGVGWASMKERAGELGGRVSIDNSASGGVVVRALLPLPAARPPSDVAAAEAAEVAR
ncbi:sensor histidine kinase [Nocardioides sp.]|uniref:sensor histidine kinase n=1 Tax=Nocardioides sp. TaxID=35761 RepID=UPI00352742BA